MLAVLGHVDGLAVLGSAGQPASWRWWMPVLGHVNGLAVQRSGRAGQCWSASVLAVVDAGARTCGRSGGPVVWPCWAVLVSMLAVQRCWMLVL